MNAKSWTCVALATAFAVGTVQAATLQWDHDGDGTPSDGGGDWAKPGSVSKWWNGSSTTNWANNVSPRDDAVFGFGAATGDLVSLDPASGQPNPIYAGNITFNNLVYHWKTRYILYKGALNFDGVFTVDAGEGRLHIDGTVLSGTGSLVLNSGTLSLRSASSYTGTTTANGGSLQLGEKAAMSTGSDFTINNGVYLQVSVASAQFDTGLSGAGSLGGLLAGTTSQDKAITYNGMIDLGLYLRAADSGNFAGNIGNLAGGGAVSNLTINSSSSTYVLTLSGTNSYSGDTTVLSGILTLAHNAVLPDTTTVYIPDSAVGKINLDFTDGTDYIAGLELGGVAQPNGKYDAVSHPAYFTGTGSLTVGPPPGPSGTVIYIQ